MVRWAIYLIGPLVLAIVVLVLVLPDWGRDVEAAERCVAQFMAAGQARDADGAYSLCWGVTSSRGGVQRFIEDNYEALFADFAGVEASGLRADVSNQGMEVNLAVLRGDIVYNDSSTLSFNAGLAAVDGGWKIWAMSIGGIDW